MGACFARVQRIAHQEENIKAGKEIIQDAQESMVHFAERCEKQWEDFTTSQYKWNQYLNETIVQLEEANNNLTKENIHLKQLMSEFYN